MSDQDRLKAGDLPEKEETVILANGDNPPNKTSDMASQPDQPEQPVTPEQPVKYEIEVVDQPFYWRPDGPKGKCITYKKGTYKVTKECCADFKRSELKRLSGGGF